MTGWYSRRVKAVIAVALLALLLVAAVSVVLPAGLVLMALGHLVDGLAARSSQPAWLSRSRA